MLIPAIFTLIGVAITALGAYFIARRNTSGKVDTSDAKTLWEEATRLREAYRVETAELRKEVGDLRTEIRRLRAELDMLRSTAAQLREDAEGWRKAAIARGLKEVEDSGIE